MDINSIHPLHVEITQFEAIQTSLASKISMGKSNIHITLCAGVDVAYWKAEGLEWGVCSIIVIDYQTKAVIEKTNSTMIVTVPYIPGYLAFRELPLIIQAAEKLVHTPDLFMLDGNGYLHPRHMGIATHAAFFLNKPTIGIAKSYFKINDVDFKMPINEAGSYEDIVIGNKLYGRVFRTHKDVKPIFISTGNDISLQTATEVTLHFINDESRLPIPVRLADLETSR